MKNRSNAFEIIKNNIYFYDLQRCVDAKQMNLSNEEEDDDDADEKEETILLLITVHAHIDKHR